jgi:23S rRNA (cytosine1962-C5)-methyltransferase
MDEHAIIRPPADAPLSLRLTRDLARAIKRGDAWVFADALHARPAAPAGAHAVLHDRKGKPLARGFYDAGSPLSFRACSTRARQPLDAAWAAQRLEAAMALRRALLDPARTTAYRLVNGEGDGMPGLVVDVYGDTAVLVLDGDGARGFWDATAVARRVAAALGLARVYERDRARGGPSGRPLVGETPEAPVTFLENGLRFEADLVQGQKTGFFLDQRDNRQRVRGASRGRRVLNVFGYTGGFSIYAAAGGATEVTTVDLAAPAIAAADANWRRNTLPGATHEGVVADAFDFLAQASLSGRRWDLVILDPPSFVPSNKAIERGRAAYERVISAGAAVTAPGGWLVASSCSSHFSPADFLAACRDGVGKARRQATVLAIHDQPVDHPTPLAMPQFRYLKFVMMRVDDAGSAA